MILRLNNNPLAQNKTRKIREKFLFSAILTFKYMYYSMYIFVCTDRFLNSAGQNHENTVNEVYF